MASSQKFIQQSEQLNQNLSTWTSFVRNINETIQSFDQNNKVLQDQIDTLNIAVQSMTNTMTPRAESSAIFGLTQSEITIHSSSDTQFTEITGVFSNIDGQLSFKGDQTITGLTLNDQKIASDQDIVLTTQKQLQGKKLIIKSNNVQGGVTRVVVTLSLKPSGSAIQPTPQQLIINIVYTKVKTS